MSHALRPYQSRALASVREGWSQFRKQLGVAATGAGKTIMFSHLAATEAGRTLILAHRQELVSQAAKKLHAATGIFASVECGEQRSMPGHGVVVASVQSMKRRLRKFAPDAFGLLICDEAHHSLSDEWQEVLEYFAPARVLGVTATPDRADKKSLGKVFENVAFEIGLLELIGDGYLAPLRAMKLPVEVRLSALMKRRGDVTEQEAVDAISPQIRELARAVAAECWDRKTLVFLPRCDVSSDFAAALCDEGIDARHVAGLSDDREHVLDWFASAGRGSAVCNAMLLTEGYDCPTVDCIVILRPTKSRSLYAQIVGRGTRIADGKENCLLLDPLWLSGDIQLCRPADLTATNDLHREKLQARLDEGLSLLDAEGIAKTDVEEAIAEQLRLAKKKKAPVGLVDPLTWAVGIHDSNLAEYEPAMPWECEAATAEQVSALLAVGLWTEDVTRGFAVQLLARISEREKLGLATPKQVKLLRQLGCANADVMTAGQAGYFLGKRLGGRRAA